MGGRGGFSSFVILLSVVYKPSFCCSLSAFHAMQCVSLFFPLLRFSVSMVFSFFLLRYPGETGEDLREGDGPSGGFNWISRC